MITQQELENKIAELQNRVEFLQERNANYVASNAELNMQLHREIRTSKYSRFALRVIEVILLTLGSFAFLWLFLRVAL